MKQSIFKINHIKAVYLLIASAVFMALFYLLVIPNLGISMYGGKLGTVNVGFPLSDLIYGVLFFLVCSFLIKIKFHFSWKNLGKFTLLGGSFILLILYNIYLTKKNPFSYSFTTGLGTILYCFIAAAFVGWFEELIFRGGILMSLRKLLQGHEVIAIILASLIFAGVHASNFLNQPYWDTVNQIVFAFTFGILLSVLYLASNNILVTMLIHTLIDTSDMFSKAIYSGAQSSGIDWIVVILSVIFLINAYYIYQKYLVIGKYKMA